MSDSHHPHHHHHSSSPSEVNRRQSFSSSSSVNHHRSPPPPHHHHHQQQQHPYANGKNNHHDDMMMHNNNNNNNNTHNYYSRNDRYGHQQHEQQYRYHDERRSSHRSNYNRERDDDEDRNHRQHHRSHHSPYNHHHHHSHNNHYNNNNNNNNREYYRSGDNHQYDSLNHRRRYSQHEQHYRQYNKYDDRHHNNNNNNNHNNNNNNNHSSSPSSLFYDTMTNLHSDTCLIRMTNDESLLSHVIQYMKHHQLNHTLMNPSIEYKRSELMRGLREKHSEWIPQRLKINVPKESFNRWVIERKTIEELYCYQQQQQQQQQQSNEENKNEEKNESVTIAATIVDPLIPSIVGYHHSSSSPSSSPSSSSSSNTTSVLLSREIFEDVPIKVNMFPKNAIEAKKSFETYMQSARVMSRDTFISPLPSTVCDHIDELCNQEQEWINQVMKSDDHHIDEENNNKHKIMNDRLKLFKSIINPIFCQYWKPLVDDLCTDLALYAHDQAKQLHDLIEKQDVSIVGDNNNNTTRSSSSVTVEENRRNHTINIYFREFQASLNLSHYHKLLRFYKIRKNDTCEQIQQQQKEQEQLHATVDMNQFHEYLTCLLIRYAAFFGGLRNRYEGSGLQSALPEKAFAYLRDEFSVQLECFASPLNSYFPNYCSMFPDIDQIFGSVGSFFDFHPTQGSFESNPPFVEELMIKMVEHIEKLLSASDKELSFIVIVPNWMDAQSLQLMCKSKFLRKDCVLEANKHGYVNGFQHNSHDNKRKFRAVHETHVFFLQNDAGYKRWTPTEEKVDGFVRAFEVLN